MKLRDRMDAMAAGRTAALAGEPVTVCPHQQDSAAGRALASAWVRAYLGTRQDARAAVSFDG